MDFPQESLECAAEVAGDLQEAENPAVELYDVTKELDYGLSGALESQTWFRYPHEVVDDGERTCVEDAVFVYAVADAMELEPRFFKAGVQGGHGIVDIAVDGERVVIDENYGLCGPVDWYDDHEIVLKESFVDGKTQETFDWVRQMSEPGASAEIENLRENPAGMLRGGQRITTLRDTPLGTVYDNVRFHDDDRMLERRIDVSSCYGDYDHLVRQRHWFDADGTPTREETVFSDMQGSDRTQVWGEIKIATLAADGDVEFAADFPAAFREHVARTVAYEEAQTGETVYDQEDLDAFWDKVQDEEEWVLDGYTIFQGRQLANRLNRLKRAATRDEDRFYQLLDRLRFRADWDTVPANIDDLLPVYMERHEEAVSLVETAETHAAWNRTVDGLQQHLQQHRDGRNPSRYGLSRAYDALAQTVQDRGDISTYRGLVVVTPDLSLPVDDSILARLQEREVTLDEPMFTATQRWQFNMEQYRLTHTLTLEESLSAYDTVITLSYDLDDAGSVQERRLRIEDTTEAAETGYVLIDQAIDSVSDVTISGLQKTATGRMEELQERPVLAAPTPHRDTDFVEKSLAAAGFYSCIQFEEEEDHNLIFGDKALDEFYDQLLREMEHVAESALTPGPRRAEAQADVEEFRSLDDDRRHHLAGLNYVKNEVLRGRADDIREQVRDAFTPEEVVVEYVAKVADAFNQVYWDDDFKETRDEMLAYVQDGLQQRLATSSDITAFVENTDRFPLLMEIDQVLDASRPWTRKGPELDALLEQGLTKLTFIETDYEQQAVLDALDSFRHRLTTRRRYQDWSDSSGIDLVSTIETVQDTVRDTPPTLHLDDDTTEQLTALLETGDD